MHTTKNIIVAGADKMPMAVDIFYTDVAPKATIIYAHGFNGFKDWGSFDIIAKQFAEAGFCFIKFNFSHNGTSPQAPEDFVDLQAYGNNNYTKELYDLQAIINWAVDSGNPHHQAINTQRIFLVGHSRGGGIVLLTAAHDQRIKAVATWASVSECKTPWGNWPQERIDRWEHTGIDYYTNSRTGQQLPLYYQLYQDYQQNKEWLNILKAIANLHIPLLICHGTNDEAVPAHHAELLHKTAPGSELFLTPSDHVFGRRHPWTAKELPEAMQAIVTKTITFFAAVL